MRLGSEISSTKNYQEMTPSFDKLIMALQAAINCFKDKSIGIYFNKDFCKFYNSTFTDLHLIGKQQFFEAYINQAASCGLDVSPLQQALQTLKNLCDDSIEENTQIADMGQYIQKYVIDVVQHFHSMSNNPENVNKSLAQDTNQALAVPVTTKAFTILPKELFKLIAEELIRERPLQAQDLVMLSLSCQALYGFFINDLKEIKNKLYLHIQVVAEPLVQAITSRTAGHSFRTLFMTCLEQTPYKKYFIQHLCKIPVKHNNAVKVIENVINYEWELIKILNISPESWSLLKQKKYPYLSSCNQTILTTHNLIEHLKLPESSQDWTLFNQLKAEGYFDSFCIHSFSGLDDNRCDFFLRELKEKIGLSTDLYNLVAIDFKYRIPILKIIGETRLWGLFEETGRPFDDLFECIRNLHGEVALGLISLLDNSLVNDPAWDDSFLMYCTGKYMNALYIYLELMDPENHINPLFRKKFSDSSDLQHFDIYVLDCIPASLQSKVLLQYPIDQDLFNSLSDNLQAEILNKEYNLSKLNPLETLTQLTPNHKWRVAALCNDKNTIFKILPYLKIASAKLQFLNTLHDRIPLNHMDISPQDFYKILDYLEIVDAITAIMQYRSLFYYSEFDCQSYIQNRRGQSSAAAQPPILAVFGMINLLIKDLNDSANLKTQKLLEVKNWLQSTKIFDAPLHNQVLLLIRDICAIEQGYLKMFTPGSEKYFYKLCTQNKWIYLQTNELSHVSLTELPPILNDAALKGKSLDVPALLKCIEQFLQVHYSSVGNVLALDDWDLDTPAGQPK